MYYSAWNGCRDLACYFFSGGNHCRKYLQIELCFSEHSELRYNDLVGAYRLEGAVSEPTAKNHIRQAKEAGMLQAKNGAYVLIPQKAENIGILQ